MSGSNRREAARIAVETKVEPLVQHIIERFDVAGLALGVVQDGELVYARGFGARSLATGEPVTPRSLFHMASISKPFVATGIMRLVEQGRLELDRPVRAYLPYFRTSDPRAGAITARHLLTHTSGLPDEEDYEWYRPEEDEGALERYVRQLEGETLLFAPGESYSYSNIGYEVLGELIAKRSGQSFESWMKEQILDPTGMADSTFLRRDVPLALATTPHFGAPLQSFAGAYPYHRAHAPSSTLHSSILDMSRWAIANLNHGELDSGRLLRRDSHDEMWREQARANEDEWEAAIGLSWFLGSYRDEPIISHGGTDPGYTSDLVLLPRRGAAVIAMANANTAPLNRLTEIVLDALLGFEPELPRIPVVVPLGRVLAGEGVEAARALYHSLRDTRPDEFDFGPWAFVGASWGAIDVAHPEAVLPLLRLGLELLPDASEIHAALGRAFAHTGETAQALVHLRRALEIEPDDQETARWLARITRDAG